MTTKNGLKYCENFVLSIITLVSLQVHRFYKESAREQGKMVVQLL